VADRASGAAPLAWGLLPSDPGRFALIFDNPFARRVYQL
jgi:hypothetical protein